MFIEVPYEFLVARYPDFVQEVESQIRKSKSKYKSSNFQDFKWGFNCCKIVATSGSLNHVIACHFSKNPTKDKIQTRIVVYRKPWWFSELLIDTPSEVIKEYSKDRYVNS